MVFGKRVESCRDRVGARVKDRRPVGYEDTLYWQPP